MAAFPASSERRSAARPVRRFVAELEAALTAVLPGHSAMPIYPSRWPTETVSMRKEWERLVIFMLFALIGEIQYSLYKAHLLRLADAMLV